MLPVQSSITQFECNSFFVVFSNNNNKDFVALIVCRVIYRPTMNPGLVEATLPPKTSIGPYFSLVYK